ncbi:hypothetical protein ACQY1Q_16080 [Tenacibaculum sp. TC6]|uniref:hypothetical protein n=1 Tax=Tenacibaculum sp. TC6 TaxID=3423223 RepID=UPI003D36B8A2
MKTIFKLLSLSLILLVSSCNNNEDTLQAPESKNETSSFYENLLKKNEFNNTSGENNQRASESNNNVLGSWQLVYGNSGTKIDNSELETDDIILSFARVGDNIFFTENTKACSLIPNTTTPLSFGENNGIGFPNLFLTRILCPTQNTTALVTTLEETNKYYFYNGSYGPHLILDTPDNKRLILKKIVDTNNYNLNELLVGTWEFTNVFPTSEPNRPAAKIVGEKATITVGSNGKLQLVPSFCSQPFFIFNTFSATVNSNNISALVRLNAFYLERDYCDARELLSKVVNGGDHSSSKVASSFYYDSNTKHFVIRDFNKVLDSETSVVLKKVSNATTF